MRHREKEKFERIRRNMAESLGVEPDGGPAGPLTRDDWLRMDRDGFSGRLLERFKAGRGKAVFNAFYEVNAGWLKGYVSNVVSRWGGSLDTEAIVADVFFDVYRSTETFTFRGGSSFRSWLCVLARNRVRKTLRSQRVRPAVLPPALLERDDRGQGDPLYSMVRREDRIRLLLGWWMLLLLCGLTIDRLPREEKKALRRHELAGWTYRALSEEMGIPLTAVAALMRRIRRKVARRIQRVLARVNGSP